MAAHRVIVGVDTTLTGLQALRVAVAEARMRGASLHVVRCWSPAPPPAGEPAGGAGAVREPGDLAAAGLIARAFADTMGGEPADLEVHQLIRLDFCGRVLVDYACRDDDLLVIGAGRRGRLHRLRRGGVVRYCVTRASCPVLVVPPPPLARSGSARALLRELRREIDQLAEPGSDR